MAEGNAASTALGSEAREGNAGIGRRDFFNEIAAGALGIAVVGAAVVTMDYLSPNVLFEPPTSFRIGTPDNFPENSVTYIGHPVVFRAWRGASANPSVHRPRRAAAIARSAAPLQALPTAPRVRTVSLVGPPCRPPAHYG